MATAMEWVSRITTVVLEMVLPGLAGQWLDEQWGTSFLALLGFALGITFAIWHLLVMTRSINRSRETKQRSTEKDSDE